MRTPPRMYISNMNVNLPALPVGRLVLNGYHQEFKLHKAQPAMRQRGLPVNDCEKQSLTTNTLWDFWSPNTVIIQGTLSLPPGAKGRVSKMTPPHLPH